MQPPTPEPYWVLATGFENGSIEFKHDSPSMARKLVLVELQGSIVWDAGERLRQPFARGWRPLLFPQLFQVVEDVGGFL
jgi:hypothetical protein